MSDDIVAAFKALSLHGMASAWPEMLGTARMKALDHETVMHQLLKAERAQREVRSMAYQMRAARLTCAPTHVVRRSVGSSNTNTGPACSTSRTPRSRGRPCALHGVFATRSRSASAKSAASSSPSYAK